MSWCAISLVCFHLIFCASSMSMRIAASPARALLRPTARPSADDQVRDALRHLLSRVVRLDRRGRLDLGRSRRRRPVHELLLHTRRHGPSSRVQTEQHEETEDRTEDGEMVS